MDPCSFVRILVGNLAIKSPASSNPSFSGKVHPSSSPCYCKIKLRGVDSPPCHVATVPLVSESETHPHSLAASFDFPKSQLSNIKNPFVKISVYKTRTNPSCVFNSDKLLGQISIPLDLSLSESRSCSFHNGWIALTKSNNQKTENQTQTQTQAQLMHLTIRSEPDPRFIFRFDGEPECSPQVFQVRGEVKQPVFTCKFSFRDRNPVQFQAANQYHPLVADRKGWSITIHDLSGSPVACASMVTPFVPSPGSQRVSKSNPGAWLIIRPDGDGTWKPWGRLEAWREPGNSNGIGYRFDVLPATADPVTLAACTINSRHGGKFTIDVTPGVTPASTPHGSWDLGSGTSSSSRPGSGSGSDFSVENQFFYRGFVMSARFDGEKKCSKPEVEVGVKHVTCTEDAAAFVALAAAMDLSMDACKSFSQKLRKELRQ